MDNLETAASTAASQGAILVGFPELCTSPYFCSASGEVIDEHYEPVPGPVVDRMSLLAKELGVVLVVPLAERAGHARYNSAAVLDADGSLAGVYRKRHLPPEERRYFQPGEPGPAVFPTAAGRIGVAICWDRFYPDIWQTLARQQARLVIVPAASRESPVNPGAAAGVTAAIVNRSDTPFSGGSLIIGPRGR